MVNVVLINGINLVNVGQSGLTSEKTTVGSFDLNFAAINANESAMVRVVDVAS